VLRVTRFFLCAIPILLLAFGTFVLAGQSVGKNAKTDKKAEKKGFAVAKTGKGPESDNLRSLTPNEEKALNAKLQEFLQQFPKHQMTTRADGAMFLVVAPEFLNFSVARKGPDGKIILDCNTDVLKIENSKIEPLPEE
jgi:hypothetical protein